MDVTIRKIAAAIKNYYVNEEKASLVAEKLEAFIGSPGWERYTNTNNLARMIWNLNCIITNTADDAHFYISPAGGGMPQRGGSTGIERFTPHYIKINEFVHLQDEYTRLQYMKVFEQVQDPLIIDVRDCPGGSPETAYFILSHLFPDGEELFELITRTNPVKLFKSVSVFPFYGSYNTVKKYTGRVSVLINGNTASAAESMTFVIKNKGRGKVYGSRSGTHAHITMGLPVDGLVVHIPFARTADPQTHEDWEGVGIVPDFDVTSKEFVDLIYRELSVNYFTPVGQEATVPIRQQPSDKQVEKNPFVPPFPTYK